MSRFSVVTVFWLVGFGSGGTAIRASENGSTSLVVTPSLIVADQQTPAAIKGSSPNSTQPLANISPPTEYITIQQDDIRHEGFDFPLGEKKKVNVGVGIRTSLTLTEDASPDGGEWSSDVELENVRIYVNGRMFEKIGFEVNTDINNAQPLLEDTIFPDGGNVRLLDAVGKFEFNNLLNVWIGRFLPPSDRSNLSGPFYLNAYTFPFVQTGYPNIFQGREDGVAYWGQLGQGVFKWQLGIFKGREGFPNGDDHVLTTARLTMNLLDPEEGYYNQSTYFGKKRILALGLAGMHQQDAVGAIADPRDFTGISLDTLFETQLGNGGVLSLESAFYFFDDDGATFVETAPGTVEPLNRQGNSFFVLAAYLFPRKIGGPHINGQLQPHVRYLHYDRDFPAQGAFEQGLDLGVHFVIDGHNARLTLVYQNRDLGAGGSRFDQFLLASQLQF